MNTFWKKYLSSQLVANSAAKQMITPPTEAKVVSGTPKTPKGTVKNSKVQMSSNLAKILMQKKERNGGNISTDER